MDLVDGLPDEDELRQAALNLDVVNRYICRPELRTEADICKWIRVYLIYVCQFLHISISP